MSLVIPLPSSPDKRLTWPKRVKKNARAMPRTQLATKTREKRSAVGRNPSTQLAKRTLNALPMKYSREDVRKLQDTLAQEKTLCLQESQKDHIACKILSKVSCRLFDEAMEEATRHTHQVLECARSSSAFSTLRKRKEVLSYVHNGPTETGSPFFNQTTSILPTRCITQSAQSRFNHERASSASQDIYHILQRSNSYYKVSNPCKSPSSLNITPVLSSTPFNNNLLLVPINESTKGSGTKGFFLTEDWIEQDFSRRVSPSIKFNSDQRSVSNEISVVPSIPMIELSSSDDQDEDNQKIHVGIGKEQGLIVVDSRGPSGTRPSSSRSCSRSRSVSMQRNPKCWVDTATVSSSEKGSTNKPETQQVPVKEAQERQPGQGATLPDFICPSSENKSKEARIRHWLQSSSFPWANCNVPLL